ncbi:GNAT family N-acetyltransferase [Saccharibacillus sp. O23]|uniref:GNAT family N-acetyltransferase n=1 Tax=Saccharibacillus sp. O23 TaxID=2009338 RepID=UPI000B4E2706|nr:GNAT family N-acetyltransferase [Saccharibacillus sp. O23]OWR31929.1 GNAT family N-acetyltransferase [Saccharibacillus sp. O23]
MTTTIRIATIEDLQTLREIGIETFGDTFAAQNKPENMQVYLEKAFDEQRLANELNRLGSTFYLLEEGGEPAGFLKLNVGEAQSEPMGDEALEIERIYIRRAFKRRGFGRKLIDLAQAAAEEQGKSKLWLGVWEKNADAAAFYERLGFLREGEHSFFMGDEEQTDWIMVRRLRCGRIEESYSKQDGSAKEEDFR